MSVVTTPRTAAVPIPLNLTSARPTPRLYRAALVVGLLLGLVTALSLPYARHPGPYVHVFLPMYAVLAGGADLLTAYLLFGQFLSTRTPALAALAATYLYSGTIILPYLLTFPSVFAPTGLLGAGPQTAVWLWSCWHGGFPLGLLLFSALDRRYRQVQLTPATARRLMAALATLVPMLIALLSLVAIRADPWLPVLVRGTHFTALFALTSPLGLTLCGLGVAACSLLLVRARGRSASVVGVWLAVAAFAYVLDIAINLWVPSRYTVGWYVSRANTVISASVVLGALLYEVARLYARLTQANANLHTSEQRFHVLSDASAGQNRALLDALPDMMFHLSEDGVVLNYKAPLDDLTRPPQALLGTHVSEWVPAEVAQQVRQATEAARRTRALQTIEYALPLRGETHHYEARIVACGSEETMAIVRDVTARRSLEDILRHQALHDALTGLPNRTLLHDRLQQAVRAARRDHMPLALLLIDLDHFKDINDTLGHPLGDRLLQQVGSRLRGILRANDTAARLGGDEFALLLPAAQRAEADWATRKILQAFDAPFTIEGHDLQVDASIGIAIYPDHGADGAMLLRHADVAMYVAKRTGHGSVVYDAGQDDNSPSRLALMSELRQAIAQDALLLYYQPQVDVHSGRVCAVEALVRWPHPEQGLIPPDQFIPLVEHSGLIVPLTLWVLKTALRQVQVWQQAGLELSVAVNLSMWNLHDLQLPDTIARLLQRHGIAPRLLRLELTESSIMADAARALKVLTRLSALGVSLSVDDFGTGYSSLAYLKRLPVDELKIDKSFVQHMATDEADAAIVRSVIALAHTLGLAVVAEGVEDAPAWDLLVAEGCDVAQGYYLSQPLPAAELTRWVGTARWGIADTVEDRSA